MPKFGKRSQKHLGTLDTDLQLILNEAIKYVDFSILCGFRDEEEQNKAFNGGYSKLKFPKSKHNKLPSLAVDVAPYPIDWNDAKRFYFLSGTIMVVAQQLEIKLIWGGHWQSFKDLPHFELV